jgi:ribonucleoside-diphosphate reductase alpha chain
MDKKDPISQTLIDSKIPYEDDQMNQTNYVFSFPIKSPDDSVLVSDVGALDQLEHWLIYAENWCEGNPSCTIYINESEWLEVGAWVYKNFDKIGGLSFLPYSGHTYKQAPYEEITKEQYETAKNNLPPHIDWELLNKYESEDNTTSSQELACSANGCEI